jgi:uncharacterized protein with HEPN domain
MTSSGSATCWMPQARPGDSYRDESDPTWKWTRCFRSPSSRLLEIVGEAATHVSEPVQAALAGIPWRQITGARNRLIHSYFDIDLDIVWAILQDDLPSLITQLEQVLPPRTRSRRQ